MASSPAGVAYVFDRATDTYDDIGVPWFQPIAQGLVDELAVQPGERVLDVGCGRGAALLPLGRAAGPTGHVLGIDLAPRMVERTARDVRGMPHVEVRIADASDPGLLPSSYDVVGCGRRRCSAQQLLRCGHQCWSGPAQRQSPCGPRYSTRCTSSSSSSVAAQARAAGWSSNSPSAMTSPMPFKNR